jgi:hypothetical protein
MACISTRIDSPAQVPRKQNSHVRRYNLRNSVAGWVRSNWGGIAVSINQEKLHELLGKAVVDFGATFHAALVGVGDKLGLYKALAAAGPQTPCLLY